MDGIKIGVRTSGKPTIFKKKVTFNEIQIIQWDISISFLKFETLVKEIYRCDQRNGEIWYRMSFIFNNATGIRCSRADSARNIAKWGINVELR